ncbi:hypothetical protein VB711_22645 [Cronbergia sp. UHCC 0137]|uniref:hypothetical protein n=1 Tax=Cronbergia sp. UHCC 0137 TaxID=3110239 RepID=UPI002B20FE4F|nr:hypothetical protein [Cronbergia sp. UHCC 0137]MEA5620617.1 hypothetical protein [Cronbergia sp. UHCC 0137]
MMIKLTKWLFTTVLFVIITFSLPIIPSATANDFLAGSRAIFAPTSAPLTTLTLTVDDLTPRERQELQSVRQRRNKEISAVLSLSQITQLAHELHTGKNLDQGIETLNLKPEQQELINAVIEFTNLKTKAIFSRHLLLHK